MVDSWMDREGQTLAVIVEHFTRPGADRFWLSELAELTGVAEPELEHRLGWLAEGEFIKVDQRARAIAGVVEVLPKGWQVSTGEPGDQVLRSRSLSDCWSRRWRGGPTRSGQTSRVNCSPRSAPSRSSSGPSRRPSCRRNGSIDP
jgi:hypothetical protein